MLLAATVATQLCVPWLLRRFGTGPVLAASMVLMGLPALGYAVSDALVPVLAWSAVRGMGFGIVTVVGSTVVAHLVSPSRRGEAVGVYGLAVAAPMIVLMPAGVAIAESIGYGWVFAIAALPLVGFPWALSLGRRVDRTPSASASAGDEIEPHITDRDTVRLVLRPTVVLFAVTMAGGALMTFAPQLGLGGGWAAAALFAMSLASALARWRVGLLADRHGPERFVAPLLLLAAAGLVVCVAAITRDQGWLLLLGALVLGPPYGALQNLTLLIAFARVPPAGIPTASAVWNLGFDSGTATGSVVVGALAAALSFGSAFSVMVVVVLAALLLAPRRTPSPQRWRSRASPHPQPPSGPRPLARSGCRWSSASSRAPGPTSSRCRRSPSRSGRTGCSPRRCASRGRRTPCTPRRSGASRTSRVSRCSPGCPRATTRCWRCPATAAGSLSAWCVRLRDGTDVTVANTHLHHLPLDDETVREPQARAILDWLGDTDQERCSSAT